MLRVMSCMKQGETSDFIHDEVHPPVRAARGHTNEERTFVSRQEYAFLKILAQTIAAPALAQATTDFDRALIEDQFKLTLQQMAE